VNSKSTILILGKLPPPLMGPAIATQIILNSSLNKGFNLVHLDTRMNADVATMGRWSFSKLFKSVGIYVEFIQKIKQHQPNLILVPISQTTMGFLKDAPFIWLGKLMGKKVLIQLRGSNFKNWLSSAGSSTNNYVRKTLKKCANKLIQVAILSYKNNRRQVLATIVFFIYSFLTTIFGNNTKNLLFVGLIFTKFWFEV